MLLSVNLPDAAGDVISKQAHAGGNLWLQMNLDFISGGVGISLSGAAVAGGVGFASARSFRYFADAAHYC